MRRLLLGSFLGIVLVALAVSTVPFAILLQNLERERLLTTLERDAFVLAGRAEEALESLSATDLAPVRRLASEYREAGGARVVIVDSQGTVVVTNDPEENRVGISYSTRPEFEESLAGIVSTGERFSDTLNMTLVFVSVPVFSGADIVGAVRLTFDKAVIDNEVQRQLAGIGVVALTTLGLGVLIAVVLSRTLGRGLRELERAATEISAGDLSARADATRGPSDIRSVAKAFNVMAERVGALVTQQKSFASDASHQLRTPITALMLRLEGLRESVADSPKSAERLDAIEAEVSRLNRLIDGLLALGRAASGTLAIEKVDASEICRERVESWANLAEEAQVGLTADIEPGLTISVVPTALEQILDVYIDNALSVSSTGSAISVALESDAGYVVLRVRDHGPGLTALAATRAFDRFWRGSSSYDGTGLGLAIVKQLADASGAAVALESLPEGGAEATARFPIL